MELMNGDWRNSAACIGPDPELFFPVGEKSQADRDQIQEAKQFCVKCLVTAQCFNYAMETHQDTGVWGGTSAEERRAIRRRIARASYQRRSAPPFSGTGQ